jgi:hypothetical protein
MTSFHHDRYQRPSKARRHFSVTEDQRFDADVVGGIDDADPPPARRRFYAETEDGARYTVRSNVSQAEVVEALTAKAGGRMLTKVWHDGEGQAPFLGRAPRMNPVDLHREALARAIRPSLPSPTPAPVDPMQALLAMAQAQAATPNADAGGVNSTLLAMAPFLAMAAQGMGQPGPQLLGNAHLSDRITEFERYMAQRQTSRSVIADSLFSLRIFVELNGDLPLRSITVDHADRFVRAISGWPRNASKRRAFRNMAAPQVVEKARRLNEQPIDEVTQQKHIERMRTFFRWLETRMEVRPNLLYSVRVNPKNRVKARKQHRRPFTEKELARIFAFDKPDRAATPFQFWVPILGFYTGARVNELSQLYVDDVIKEEGRWLLSIAMDRPGQHIKNTYSRRLVPIHDHLIKLGFLRFVEQAKRWERARLFPDVTWGRNGPGETVSRWFANMVRTKLKLDDPGQTFHAFRNTFIYYATRSKVPAKEYSPLTGHAVATDALHERYVRELDAAERCAVFDRINFPKIDHPRYLPEQYDRLFRRARAEEQHEARMNEAYRDG